MQSSKTIKKQKQSPPGKGGGGVAGGGGSTFSVSNAMKRIGPKEKRLYGRIQY